MTDTLHRAGPGAASVTGRKVANLQSRVFIGLAAVVLLLSSGCAALKPWERGLLVDPAMAAPTEPLEAAHSEHVLRTRESMIGASGTGGVSCGCN